MGETELQEVRKIAEMANVLGQHAVTSATLNGILVQALITSMLESGSVQREVLDRAFRTAQALIIKHAAEVPGGHPTHLQMLDMLRRFASNHGIQLANDSL